MVNKWVTLKTDFDLGQVSYTVGGILFSAADIEYAILKMKPPAHRPQIVCLISFSKNSIGCLFFHDNKYSAFAKPSCS